jgi:hypothetical protein
VIENFYRLDRFDEKASEGMMREAWTAWQPEIEKSPERWVER